MGENVLSEQLQLPVIRQLASSDTKTRGKAIKFFYSWFPLQSEFSEMDMKKIWKGLFYCVWHADKLPFQADLVEKLSSLLLVLDPRISEQYFSVFLLTMRREWSGINALRLDKFYLLMRRFLHYFFQLLEQSSWDLEATKKLISVMDDRVFTAKDNLTSKGVSYHIASIFMEEIKGFLPLENSMFDVLLQPFISAMAKSQDKVLVNKIKTHIFEFILKMGKDLMEIKKVSGDADSEVGSVGVIALTMGFSGKFYELGSSAECLQGNRKTLFHLHDVFLKLDKELERSGLSIELPVVNKGNRAIDAKPLSLNHDSGNGSIVKPSSLTEEENETVEQAFDDCGSGNGSIPAVKNSNRDIDGKSLSLTEEENATVKEASDDHDSENGSNGSDDDVMSNLQMKFEKAAAEFGLKIDESIELREVRVDIESPVNKKRKKMVKVEGTRGGISSENGHRSESCETSKMEKVKKVRFSLKNNVVWKPHTPLPPQSLRLPPAAVPRGSALKKGLSPGPIREVLSSQIGKKKKRVRNQVTPPLTTDTTPLTTGGMKKMKKKKIKDKSMSA